MNKSELSAHVARTACLSKVDAATAVDAVFSAIAETLLSGERVAVAGFGTFTTRHRPARQARNPATGESIAVPSSRAPAFKAGKALSDHDRRHTTIATSFPSSLQPPPRTTCQTR